MASSYKRCEDSDYPHFPCVPSLELDRSVRRDRDTFAYPPQSRHVSGARDSFAAAMRGLDGKRIHRESIILWFSKRSGMRSDDQEYFKGVTLVARDQCFLLLFSLYFPQINLPLCILSSYTLTPSEV